MAVVAAEKFAGHPFDDRFERAAAGNAITGLPHACASSGVMPKSSSPGKRNAGSAPANRAPVHPRDDQRKRTFGFAIALQARAIASIAGDDERQAEFVERLHREVNPLVWH